MAADGAITTFEMLLIVVAAVAVLFLGTVGLFGVLSYAVGQRRREIGVRVALGARSGDVARLVALDAALLTGAGLVLGTLAALLLTRFLAGMLYHVSPTDPATFAATAGLLAVVTAVACGLPVRQALAEE